MPYREMPHMSEVWFRNPHNYVRELVEVRYGNVAWDMGLLVKRGIDPHRHAKLYFEQANIPWRALLVGDQGTIDIDHDHKTDNPRGVYPTWRYGEDFELLEEMMAMPAGDDPSCYGDMTVKVEERPVQGQEHRVIVTDLPNASTGPGKALIRKIHELQDEYPTCIVHIHGLYSYRIAFGMGFGAGDMDSRTKASKGTVVLPNGKEMLYEKTMGCPQWVTMLGMRPVDLKEARNRCIYNIRSAIWAGANWDSNLKFRSTPSSAPVDTTSVVAVPQTTHAHMSLPIQPKPGDRQVCDTCSLQNQCKYFRDGAVCSVPGTEAAGLAQQLGSRNADTIVDALGTLLSTNARRLERGLQDEQEYGDINGEVTKISNQLFNQGVQLAKLLDPALRGGAKVQVNVGGGSSVSVSAAPNQVMAAIVRQFEGMGIPRAEITPDMVAGVLTQMSEGTEAPKAIEGVVLASRSER